MPWCPLVYSSMIPIFRCQCTSLHAHVFVGQIVTPNRRCVVHKSAWGRWRHARAVELSDDRVDDPVPTLAQIFDREKPANTANPSGVTQKTAGAVLCKRPQME